MAASNRAAGTAWLIAVQLEVFSLCLITSACESAWHNQQQVQALAKPRTPAPWGQTCSVASRRAAPRSLEWSRRAMALPYRGQPGHACADPTSVLTASRSHADTRRSAHPILLPQASLSPYLATRGRTSPVKASSAFYRRQLYFKSLRLAVVSQDRELMSAEVTWQGKTLTSYEGRCQF